MNKCKAEGCRNTRYLYDDLCISHKAREKVLMHCLEYGVLRAVQDVTSWTPEEVAVLADIQHDMGRTIHIKRG